MKAIELMIGNLVMIKGNENVIFEIHQNTVEIVSSLMPVEIGDVEPIPLTEEWLLKFGFKNSYSKEWWKGEIIYDTGFVSKEVPAHGTYVQYVHQLQNLYHALTGKELTIKELA